jgi:hypothetical protein
VGHQQMLKVDTEDRWPLKLMPDAPKRSRLRRGLLNLEWNKPVDLIRSGMRTSCLQIYLEARSKPAASTM